MFSRNDQEAHDGGLEARDDVPVPSESDAPPEPMPSSTVPPPPRMSSEPDPPPEPMPRAPLDDSLAEAYDDDPVHSKRERNDFGVADLSDISMACLPSDSDVSSEPDLSSEPDPPPEPMLSESDAPPEPMPRAPLDDSLAEAHDGGPVHRKRKRNDFGVADLSDISMACPPCPEPLPCKPCRGDLMIEKSVGTFRLQYVDEARPIIYQGPQPVPPNPGPDPVPLAPGPDPEPLAPGPIPVPPEHIPDQQ